MEPTTMLAASVAISSVTQILGGISAKKEAELNAYQLKTDSILNQVRASQMAEQRLRDYDQATSTNLAAFAAAGRDIGSDRSVKAFLEAEKGKLAEDISRAGTQTELERLQSMQAMATERRKGRTALAVSILNAADTASSGYYDYKSVQK